MAPNLPLPPQLSTDPGVNSSAMAWAGQLVDALQKILAGTGQTQTYTPTWTASVSNPALGNGVLAGRYLQIGKLVFCSVSITMGSTTTYGSGAYTISLPVPAADSATTGVNYTGSVLTFDSSAGAFYTGLSEYFTTTTIAMLTNAQPGAFIGTTSPFTWATSDRLVFTHTYEAA